MHVLAPTLYLFCSSLCLFAVHQFVCPSVYFSSICSPIPLFIHLFIYLVIRSFVHLFICLFNQISIHLSMRRSIHLSLCSSISLIWPFIYLFVCSSMTKIIIIIITIKKKGTNKKGKANMQFSFSETYSCYLISLVTLHLKKHKLNTNLY